MQLTHDMDAFLTLTLALRARREAGELEHPEAQAALGRLRELHDRLMAAAPGLVDRSDPPTPAERAQAERDAILRLHHLRDTALEVAPQVDTLGSQTLPLYVPETPPPDPSPHLPLPPAFVHELEALGARRRLLQRLLDAFGLPEAGRAGAARLLKALVPAQALGAEDVDLVATSTALLFCLPIERGDADAADPTLRFLARCAQADQRGMAFFPAFSPLRPHHPDPALLRLLAPEVPGLDEASLRALVASLVTVLPRLDADKYIVHDVWGHHWQAHLFAFEDAYQRIAAYADLPADLPPPHGLPGFIRHRVLDALIALTAEILADAVEFRFNQIAPLRLPSSSFFDHLPTKLDLTLADLPLYLRFATRGLREAPSGHPVHDLLTDPAFLPAPLEHHGQPNLFAQHARHYLALHHALNYVLTQPHAPIEQLLFALAAFYEQDPHRNLPRLASFLLPSGERIGGHE
jgi:hypothetical protein